jgi:hypothetical protein
MAAGPCREWKVSKMDPGMPVSVHGPDVSSLEHSYCIQYQTTTYKMRACWKSGVRAA